MIRWGELFAEEGILAGEIQELHRGGGEIGWPFGPPLPPQRRLRTPQPYARTSRRVTSGGLGTYLIKCHFFPNYHKLMCEYMPKSLEIALSKLLPSARHERRVGAFLVHAARERRPEGPDYLLSSVVLLYLAGQCALDAHTSPLWTSGTRRVFPSSCGRILAAVPELRFRI